MSKRKSSPLDKILGRLEDLDSANMAILVQRLARDRRLLETVINTVREGILVITEDGLIEYANFAAAELIGFRMRDVGRAILWKLVPDLVRTLDIAVDGSYSQVSAVTRDLELKYPETRFVRLYMVPMLASEDDSVAGVRFVVIVSDITQEKLSTRELIENERVASVIMLAAGVAHELGNPLNSLTIHLQLIARWLGKVEADPAIEKISNSIDVCRGEVERLDEIITHFLEAVRPRPPDFQNVNLIRALEDVLEIMGPELSDQKIHIDIETGEKPPEISADYGQIKQVYFNVLKNACEAMEAGGTIKVRTRYDDEYLYLQIGDTGGGISDEDFSKVFHPYFSTKKGGHGLGMMIVQRIMRDHGANIGIDSRQGAGTVITLQFPLLDRRIRLLND